MTKGGPDDGLDDDDDEIVTSLGSVQFDFTSHVFVAQSLASIVPSLVNVQPIEKEENEIYNGPEVYIRVCGCCDLSLETLLERLGFKSDGRGFHCLNLEKADTDTIEKNVRTDLKAMHVAEDDILGMIEMCTKDMEKTRDLNDPEIQLRDALVQKCVDFLIQEDEKDDRRSLWDFVVDDLHFGRDSGYDYILMSYMDTMDIIEHGGGIRCSWLTTKYKKKMGIPLHELEM